MAVRSEGGPQVVQEVSHHHKEHGMTFLETVVGDGRCQMGLTAAHLSHKKQPAVRTFCKTKGSLVGNSQTPLLIRSSGESARVETLKGHLAQHLQGQRTLVLNDRVNSALQ